MIISFIGPSGCGKGTQGKILSDREHFTIVSGGSLLREEYKQKTKMGINIYNKYWKNGLWVPDDIIFRLIIDRFNKVDNSDVIFDAYPRTYNQAILLDDYLFNIGKTIDLVFIFNLSSGVANKRIIAREKDEKRKDSGQRAIAQRLKNYYKDIEKIRRYYNGKVVDINAQKSIESISNFIRTKIYENKK